MGRFRFLVKLTGYNSSPALLVVPGHGASVCGLVLNISCRHLGTLPLAGGYKGGQFHAVVGQGGRPACSAA